MTESEKAVKAVVYFSLAICFWAVVFWALIKLGWI